MEDLCKPYSQILFYLCTSQEFNSESHEITERKHDSNFSNLYFKEFDDNFESCLKFFVCYHSLGTVKLSIRRRKIRLDTAEKLKRAFKNGSKLFSVHFIGEEAVDAGGPLREFFSVLFDDIKN